MALLYFIISVLDYSLVGIIDGRVSAGTDMITLLVLIAIVLAQPLGAFLLKDAIQNYFNDKSRQPLGSPGFFFFIMVVVLHLVFFGMLVSDLIVNFGFDYVSIFDDYPFHVDIVVGVILFIACVLLSLLTCLIIFPTDKNTLPRNSIIKILLGDFIISFSAFVFISVIWDNLLALVAGELSDESFGLKTVVVILFYFLFLMIYLPPGWFFW